MVVWKGTESLAIYWVIFTMHKKETGGNTLIIEASLLLAPLENCLPSSLIRVPCIKSKFEDAQCYFSLCLSTTEQRFALQKNLENLGSMQKMPCFVNIEKT